MLVASPARAAEVHRYHARAMPQRENGCGAFALACLLRGLGFDEWDGHEIEQDLAAYLAGMVALADEYPFDGDEGTRFQAEQGFERRYKYPLTRASDLGAVGTSPEGLTVALDTLTAGRLTALPVAGRKGDGAPISAPELWKIMDCLLHPDRFAWEAQVLFNYQTGHLAALEGPGQGWGEALFGEPTQPCSWDVGHVTSLSGVVTSKVCGRALVIRDSSPRFGWRGYHLENAEAVAAALARTDGSAGGMLVVCRVEGRPVVAEALRDAVPDLALELWDNGSTYVPARMLRGGGGRS